MRRTTLATAVRYQWRGSAPSNRIQAKSAMKLSQFLNKPEYIFRPTQIYRRMMRLAKKRDRQFELVTLPWGVGIRVRPTETIGHSIATMGVYDLSVTEVLWRLIDPGEVVIDIGANIGYMTSIMAKRAGGSGRVYAYEPHPEIYAELCENETLWRETCGWTQVDSRKLALSDTSGIGSLNMPPQFRENRGVASLLNDMYKPVNGDACAYEVRVARLDDLRNDGRPIGVIKIDVEGHELKVLRGGVKVINDVRDIVFEEHRDYPTDVTCFLEDRGFTLFRFSKEVWGPRLEVPAGKPRGPLLPWEAPSYLATKDPLRAMKRMEKRGWRAFSDN